MRPTPPTTPASTALRRLAFVDVETTGLDPATDRIAEIGVVTVDDGGITEWGSFVVPRRGADARLPRGNGVSLAPLPDSAPTFRDIAGDLERRLAGRLFIAHNARFDYAFIKAEFERVGVAFSAQIACTVMLSRRLYPGHAAHDLDALVDRHGLAAFDRHRALPDARTLAECWFAIEREQGRERLAEAVAELLTGPVLPAHLEPALVDRLPDSPGVYVFHGAGDAILRIGAAHLLRSALRSYFRVDRASANALAISHRIEKITWRATQGMLGARLQRIALANAMEKRRKASHSLLSWRADPERHPCLELVEISREPLSGATDLFGMFDSERKSRNALVRLSQRHSLCHAALGVAQSKCVRCHACDDGGIACGEKTQRLRHLMKSFVALRPIRVAPWPYPGPIVVRERRDLHVFNEWRHIGTMKTESDVLEAMRARVGDLDAAVYGCLVRSLPRIAPDRIRRLQNDGAASMSSQRFREAEKEKADTACRPLGISGGDEEGLSMGHLSI